VFFSCENEIFFRIEETKFLIAVDNRNVTSREGSSVDEECSREINIGPLLHRRSLSHVLVYSTPL